MSMKVFEIAKGSTSFAGLRAATRDKPKPGPKQVLVRLRAASLNYRDLAVITGNYFGGAAKFDMIPLSDGAGEVDAVGAEVKTFKKGDRVVAAFAQPEGILGSPVDGVLSEYRAFDEAGLIPIPEHLSFAEAACLPCAGVTAWNALFGGAKTVKPGDSVLALGTGGVSIFALQIAKMAGARVIVTSSSDDKLKQAKALGADALINYKKTPEWHQEVLKLTGGLGADHIVEVGGAGTLPKSYQAVGPGGQIGLIGVLSRPEGDLNPHGLMLKGATLRGIFVGGKELLEGLARAISVNKMKPVIDKTFAFDKAAEAYVHLAAAKHFGKVVVSI